MEAVGRLAGGVAHDFNNLLTIINGYAEILSGQFQEGDSRRPHLDEILKAGNRAASLTRQLLTFGRRQVLAPQVLDLNSVVNNVEKMLRRLLREDIELVTDLGPNLGRVKADLGQIEQVIINLAVNARDAMPAGGTLTLQTANAEMDRSRVCRLAPMEPGTYVTLAVSDTGVGMDADTQKRIFEPFFTTKEVGKGTGLGLATVYGIVKQSGGFIWVNSAPGRGATFTIYLPQILASDQQIQQGKTDAELPVGNETILLVEDESGVRSALRNMLEASGYRVLDAEDGDQAIAIANHHKGAIQLLLTDVVMPKMNGRQVTEHLLRQRPKMKVLYISGYTENAIVHQGVLDPSVRFLQKPVSQTDLAKKLRQTLDGSAD